MQRCRWALSAPAWAATSSRYARRRWAGSATPGRPDEAFERSLKGLDDRFSLFIFSLPTAYTLVTPSQIINFAMRSDKGTIRVAGNKWREGWGMGRILTLFAARVWATPVTLRIRRRSCASIWLNPKPARHRQTSPRPH